MSPTACLDLKSTNILSYKWDLYEIQQKGVNNIKSFYKSMRVKNELLNPFEQRMWKQAIKKKVH